MFPSEPAYEHKQDHGLIQLECVHFLGEASLKLPISAAVSALDLLAAAATTTTEQSAPMEMEDREDVGEFKVPP